MMGVFFTPTHTNSTSDWFQNVSVNFERKFIKRNPKMKVFKTKEKGID